MKIDRVRSGDRSMLSSSDDYSVINRILLRFRPIAPKPVCGEPTSSKPELGRGDGAEAGRRAKRKYVRVCGHRRKGNRGVRRRSAEGGKPDPPENSGIENPSPLEEGPVTLQLMPDKSEGDFCKSCNNSMQRVDQDNRSGDPRPHFDSKVSYAVPPDSVGTTASFRKAGSVVDTWIIVERVTDYKLSGGISLLRFSWDEVRIYDLERDTCPSFISDSRHRVIWVNEAYRKLFVGPPQWLEVKVELPNCPLFVCSVRIINGQKWKRTVACDVWRMESGGFAWKLDVNTALTLGLN